MGLAFLSCDEGEDRGRIGIEVRKLCQNGFVKVRGSVELREKSTQETQPPHPKHHEAVQPSLRSTDINVKVPYTKNTEFGKVYLSFPSVGKKTAQLAMRLRNNIATS